MNIRRSLKQWRAVRRTEHELGQMSTRELDDLGISRADIGRIAREAAKFV